MTEEQARAEYMELRRIMTGTNDADRLVRVIACAGYLMLKVPDSMVPAVQGMIMEAGRRELFARCGI